MLWREKTQLPAPVLDETVLDALGWLQGKQDAEFVGRLIAMYLETALVLLVRLKEGVVHDDISALHHASHALKSCSATIGAYSLAGYCERLESATRDGQVPDHPASWVKSISVEYRRVEAALIARLTRAIIPYLTDRETNAILPS